MTDSPDREHAERDADPELVAAADAVVDRRALVDDDELDGPTSNDYSIAFSPRNVAVGLAIVAGLVAFAARRHRRRDGGGRENG
jgi:hypothetical protein